ncbi:sigma-70 family RNA polymerase sigma factor [Streptomyces sp. NPDC048392]|uniref:sigma-70 family RNA polymerase sigma factor n=1 Tax=Streptomyces sp. NPDC048392 TaxID=3365543 RepID=UPI003713195F
MTTAPPTTCLTESQRRAVAPLVYGASNEAIGARTHLSAEGVASHLRTVRKRLDRRGCSRPVLVHALLSIGEVSAPVCERACPDFSMPELRLIRAIAEYSRNEDIAQAVGVRADDVRAEIDAAVATACADNATHLIGLAHAWGVFGAARGARPSASAVAAEADR